MDERGVTWPRCAICGEEITDTMLAESHSDRVYHPQCLPVAVKPEPPAPVEATVLPEWVATLINPLPRRMKILEVFQERGVVFRVCEGRLQYQDPQQSLSPGEHAFIKDCAEGLKEAVLKQQRLCTRCQMEAAHRGADWCRECIGSEGWTHYQRLASRYGKKAKRASEAQESADNQEERRATSLWD